MALKIDYNRILRNKSYLPMVVGTAYQRSRAKKQQEITVFENAVLFGGLFHFLSVKMYLLVNIILAHNLL